MFLMHFRLMNRVFFNQWTTKFVALKMFMWDKPKISLKLVEERCKGQFTGIVLVEHAE